MIVIHPVLETGALPDYELRPVAEQPAYHLTRLNGTLSHDQVGTVSAFDRSLEITAPLRKSN